MSLKHLPGLSRLRTANINVTGHAFWGVSSANYCRRGEKVPRILPVVYLFVFRSLPYRRSRGSGERSARTRPSDRLTLCERYLCCLCWTAVCRSTIWSMPQYINMLCVWYWPASFVRTRIAKEPRVFPRTCRVYDAQNTQRGENDAFWAEPSVSWLPSRGRDLSRVLLLFDARENFSNARTFQTLESER